jgi:hypothetical protein
LKAIILTVEELTAYGISKQAVYKAKAARRISLKNGRLDPLKALAKLRKNQDPTKPDALIKALELALADRGASPAEPEAERDSKPTEAESFFAARERKERALADIHEMEAAKMRKELIGAADAERVWAGMIAAARSQLLALPTNLGHKLAMESDQIACVEILRDAVYRVLTELSRYRPGEES